MTPSTDLSILTLIANASLVVQAVLALLLLLSLLSWTYIFQKFFIFKKTQKQVDAFERKFWSGAELTGLLEECQNKGAATSIEERVFMAGMQEFLKLDHQHPDTVSSVSRAMSAVYTREIDALERGLPALATIGSTSPFIGLFGTVWGIMNAFTGLASLENVSLAVVAPGIAEALVATAIGLFAAIPATAAFNYYNNRLTIISNRLDGFSEEFLNILQRQNTRG